MTNVQYWIAHCCRRMNRGLILKVTAEWLAIWLCLFGTVTLLTKVVWPVFWPQVLWLGLTVVPVLVFSVRSALRNRYTMSDGAAFLDGRLRAGGLLMTVAEKHDGEWRKSLPREEFLWQSALPKVRPVRFARVVVLPLLFAVIALLLPVRSRPSHAATTTRRPLPAVEELPELLAELKKADILDAGESAYLQEEIDKLVKSTAKAPPTAETWRKIDSLRVRLNNRLETEARIIDRGRKAVRKLARAGKNGIPPLTKPQRRQLEQDISAALKRVRDTGKLDPKSKSVIGKSAKKNTEKKTSSKTGGTAVRKKNQKPSKTAGKQTPSKKQPSGITGTNKNPQNKTGNGSKKTGKTEIPAKTKQTKSKQSSGGNVAKKNTPGTKRKSPAKVGQKSPQGKKRPAAAGKQKSPAGKQQIPDLSKLPDVAKLLKMVENMPPEMRERLMQEVMRMAKSGQFRIPDDPAVRQMLMKQVRRLLEKDGILLEKLRKRFGHIARDFPVRPQLPKHNAGSGSGPRGDKNKPSVSFRDIILPPNLLGKPRPDPDSVSLRKPVVAPYRPTAKSAPKAVTDSGNAKWRALRRRVRPRNRNLVYRYFFGKPEK